MDVVLIDASMGQQTNGNQVDGTFTTTAYSNVLKICREELNLCLDKEHLKNRIKTLKSNFNACHDLFKSLSGFAWNPISKLFEAENEVWKTLIEAKPTTRRTQRSIIMTKYMRALQKTELQGMVLQSAKEKIKQREKESETSHFVDLEHSR